MEMERKADEVIGGVWALALYADVSNRLSSINLHLDILGSFGSNML